jgi:hypothetical protein
VLIVLIVTVLFVCEKSIPDVCALTWLGSDKRDVVNIKQAAKVFIVCP